jgi:hypothetical protein
VLYDAGLWILGAWALQWSTMMAAVRMDVAHISPVSTVLHIIEVVSQLSRRKSCFRLCHRHCQTRHQRRR